MQKISIYLEDDRGFKYEVVFPEEDIHDLSRYPHYWDEEPRNLPSRIRRFLTETINPIIEEDMSRYILAIQKITSTYTWFGHVIKDVKSLSVIDIN